MLKKPTQVITIKGRVQGIGFRPFIFRVAKKLRLKGYVKNTKSGVVIECQGDKTKELIKILKKSPPPLAKITNISIKTIKKPPYEEFVIEKSTDFDGKSETAEIMPDLAVCKACIRDFTTKTNRRYFYPFTNCTQCGPRYSIIKKLPYDRPNTTMDKFLMCESCSKEYKDPKNRRFHAQPNACPVCGPKLYLCNNKGEILLKSNNLIIIKKVQKLLKSGKIIAIKSIGGFQIACDAQNDHVVMLLRKRKNRPTKPFAIMVKDLKTVRKLAYVSKQEEKLLKSHLAPIVLLQKKDKAEISKYVAPNNGYLGIMLPYTPLHKLLFFKPKLNNVSRETFNWVPEVLVMTSANPKGEPIVSTKTEVVKKLGRVVDYILDHDRPIESRCDDSILFWPSLRNSRVRWAYPIIIRYSRGFVPQPIYLENIRLKPILAFGSDLKNYFAIGFDNKVYLSPYIGDLINETNINFFFEMLDKYIKWFNFKPEIVVCDLHPDYVSTRLAENYAGNNKLKLVKVQHHFAHLAGVYAENNLTGDAIGIAFDGTGYGTDHAIWGSEIMVFNPGGYERIAHLKYMPLIGGDTAITNPKLILKAYLDIIDRNLPVNITKTSSMGRLFDAVSSLLELCHKQSYEGEAPSILEAYALKAQNNLSRDLLAACTQDCFDPLAILKSIVEFKRSNYSISELALWFHKRIVNETVKLVENIARMRRIYQVCLSGGVFQNRIVFTFMASRLKKLNFCVYTNKQVPINDGGIALGQIVAANQMKK
ncbi:MAG: carbamoyltransferase HypF [candidate division WOR-3 bacterium]|nr:carbamoyltransferase HypF [candidate division WOR-3 bacterium]